MIGTSCKQGRFYILDQLKVPYVVASSVDLSSFRLNPSSSSFYLWHSHLGHVSTSRLKYLVSTKALGDLKPHDIFDNSSCKLVRFYALSFHNSILLCYTFDMIHSDTWGPSHVITKGGLVIVFLLLMITIVIVGFILFSVVMIFLLFTIFFEHLLKLNILLSSNIFGVIWVVSIRLILLLNYLP